VSNSSTGGGVSLRYKILLASGVITLAVVVAVFCGSYFAAKGRLVRSMSEQMDSFSKSLRDTIDLELTLFQDRCLSNLSVAMSQLPGDRIMESVNKVKIGERELPTLFIMGIGSGLKQITGSNDIVDQLAEQLNGQFLIYQIYKDESGEKACLVSTTFKDSKELVLGAEMDPNSPIYQTAIRAEGIYRGFQSIDGVQYYVSYRQIKDAGGTPLLLLGTAVSVEPVMDYVKKVAFTQGSFAFAIDDEGKIIVHPSIESGTPASQALPGFWESYSKVSQSLSKEAGHLNFKYALPSGESYLVSLFEVGGLGWKVALNVPGSYVLAPVAAMRNAMIMYGLPVLVAGLLLMVFLLGKLLAPFRTMLGVANSIASGDLSVAVKGDMDSKDEVTAIMGAFERIRQSFKDLVERCNELYSRLEERDKDLRQIESKIEVSSNNSLEASREIVSVIASVSSAVEETNAGVEEVASGAQNTAKITTELSERSSAVNESVRAGSEAVFETVAKINGLGESGERIKEAISSLDSAIKGITQFVDTITSIADQTNLLALNAAIEAARAGEAGRGFAVVAEEVRKLAEASAEAAKKVQDVIGDIEQRAKDANREVNETVGLIEEAVASSQETSAQIQSITEQVKGISEGIQSIAAVAEEQAASAEEIASAMEDILNKVTRGQMQAEEVERSSKELMEQITMLSRIREEQTELMEDLKKALAFYKLNETSQKAGLVPLQ